jgi:hypothetical protein
MGRQFRRIANTNRCKGLLADSAQQFDNVGAK